MDPVALMLELLAGTVGMGMLMYGKSTQKLVPIGSGLALMVVPYFIGNLVVMTIVCSALAGLPFVFRYE
ncbi:MAG TPA: hypothetical protein VF796_25300 [Humisphaera sp.]